ncbi:MAG TPA: PTS sugar transporter subunit IIC [Haloplasmataceae bacterium]
MKKITIKDYLNRVLNGMSIGVVITLVPPALIGELAKALDLTTIGNIVNYTSYFLGTIIGLCIALKFNLSTIEVGSVAIASGIASGSFKIIDGTITLSNIGDVINASLTALLAVIFIQLIGNRLKNYTIIILPTLVIVVVGFIGLSMLPYVSYINTFIGTIINKFTELQPILMGILVAVSFALLIPSPISSVGVATAIGLSGISAGVANLGASVACVVLGVLSLKTNGWGKTIAIIFGSPKLQMTNYVNKPKIMLPVILVAAFIGAIGGLLNVQGTTQSAGFGIIGLIGPINYLNIVNWTTKNIFITISIYLIIPIILTLIIRLLLLKNTSFISDEDYRIIL